MKTGNYWLDKVEEFPFPNITIPDVNVNEETIKLPFIAFVQYNRAVTDEEHQQVMQQLEKEYWERQDESNI